MPDGPEQTVRALFAAFAARDAAGGVAVLDPDMELWAQPTGEAVGRHEPYHGHDGWRAYLEDVDRAWAEFTVDPQDFRVAGSGVIAFGRAHGVRRDDGQRVDVPVIWVYRLRAGKVAYCRVAKTAAEAERMVA